MTRLCTAPACDRSHYALGLCQRHYQRLRKYGTTARPAVGSRSFHGTRSRYSHGCRCDECRWASRIYMRTRRLHLAWAPIFTAYLERAG